MGRNLIFLGLGIILAVLITWNSNTPNDDEIIIQARELGMEFTEEIEKQMYATVEEQIRAEMEQGALEQADKEKIVIDIPSGASAQTIANILSENGFDGEGFLQEITEQNILRQIKYGSYEISKDLEIEEIINLLTN